MSQLKILLLSLMLSVAILIAGLQPQSASAAPAWSVGMYTINTCSLPLAQHCRSVATELTFAPGCYYITANGTRMKLQLWGEYKSGKPGHKEYRWGVETRWATANPFWRSYNWRFYRC